MHTRRLVAALALVAITAALLGFYLSPDSPSASPTASPSAAPTAAVKIPTAFLSPMSSPYKMPSASPTLRSPTRAPTMAPTPPPSSAYLLRCAVDCLAVGYDYCDDAYVIASNFEHASCGCYNVHAYYPNHINTIPVFGTDTNCARCGDTCVPPATCTACGGIRQCRNTPCVE